MRNFKKICLMLLILIGMEWILGFLLEPVTYQRKLEQDLKVMEMRNWIPNVVLLGDSMVSCGLIPGEMEETMGSQYCVLNAGTASQQVWGSFYYLKDLLEQYPVKKVVLGVDQWAFTQQDESIRRDLVVLNRIKNPMIKLEYVRNIFQIVEYPYLIKSYANREEIVNVPQNIKEKLSGGYLFASSKIQSKEDLLRGYTPNGLGMGKSRAGLQKLDTFSMQNLNQRAVEYLDKIVELCRKKGADLYIISMPFVSTAVYATETYSSYHDFFRTYSEEKGITYWDLNLLRQKEEVVPDELLHDLVHLGEHGAQKVSRKLGELLRKDEQDSEVKNEFWPSVEAWEKSYDGIIGCDFHTEAMPDISDRIMLAKSIQAEGVIPEYEFWVSQDGAEGNWIKLQGYGRENQCIIPGKYFENDVWLKVCCRVKGASADTEKCCIRLREFGE